MENKPLYYTVSVNKYKVIHYAPSGEEMVDEMWATEDGVQEWAENNTHVLSSIQIVEKGIVQKGEPVAERVI